MHWVKLMGFFADEDQRDSKPEIMKKSARFEDKRFANFNNDY